MDTKQITKDEFIAFVVTLADQKVKGQLLTATLGDYSFQIAGVAGTLRITVSGGPKDGWTRRQGITKPNVAAAAATLWDELNRNAASTKPQPTQSDKTIAVQAARIAIADAASTLRTYGPRAIPTNKAANNARIAIARALSLGAAERDILHAA